jgi:ribosomal protein S18 acetylase RimI-like enzyme
MKLLSTEEIKGEGEMPLFPFGAVQAAGRALARLKLIAKYNTLDFYFAELSSSSKKKPVVPPSLTVREVNFHEWERLRFAEGLSSRGEIQKQFERQSRLFAALQGDTVVAMNWVNEQFADLAHINRPRVTFPRGTVYSYQAVVAPACRRQGIGTLLKQNMLPVLQSEGCRLLFLAVFLKNVVPHLWHQANGFKRWGRITYIDLRVKGFWWTRLTEEGRRYPGLFYA